MRHASSNTDFADAPPPDWKSLIPDLPTHKSTTDCERRMFGPTPDEGCMRCPVCIWKCMATEDPESCTKSSEWLLDAFDRHDVRLRVYATTLLAKEAARGLLPVNTLLKMSRKGPDRAIALVAAGELTYAPDCHVDVHARLRSEWPDEQAPILFRSTRSIRDEVLHDRPTPPPSSDLMLACDADLRALRDPLAAVRPFVPAWAGEAAAPTLPFDVACSCSQQRMDAWLELVVRIPACPARIGTLPAIDRDLDVALGCVVSQASSTASSSLRGGGSAVWEALAALTMAGARWCEGTWGGFTEAYPEGGPYSAHAWRAVVGAINTRRDSQPTVVLRRIFAKLVTLSRPTTRAATHLDKLAACLTLEDLRWLYRCPLHWARAIVIHYTVLRSSPTEPLSPSDVANMLGSCCIHGGPPTHEDLDRVVRSVLFVVGVVGASANANANAHIHISWSREDLRNHERMQGFMAHLVRHRADKDAQANFAAMEQLGMTLDGPGVLDPFQLDVPAIRWLIENHGQDPAPALKRLLGGDGSADHRLGWDVREWRKWALVGPGQFPDSLLTVEADIWTAAKRRRLDSGAGGAGSSGGADLGSPGEGTEAGSNSPGLAWMLEQSEGDDAETDDAFVRFLITMGDENF